MAKTITVKMRDGSERVFKHRGRAGGSYTITAKYQDAFLVIEDEWYRQTAIPADIIAEVVVEPLHYGI